MRKPARIGCAFIGCVFVWAVVLIGASGPSAADPLLGIDYDVTSGTFPDSGFGGPITGAVVEITLPGTSTSTPVYCLSNCGTIYVLLTGPYGTIPFSYAPLTFLSVTPSQVAAIFTATYRTAYSWHTTGILNYPATGKTYGTGHITGTTLTYGTFTFSIPFQFGNEVRLLPEPSAPSALAAGVVLLGLIGAFGARARSARRGQSTPGR
jgi:hypothetical protein